MTTRVSQRQRRFHRRLAQWWAYLANDTVAYVFKRILQALVTLWLASALSFFIIQLAPGNYLNTLQQNPQISQEYLADLAQRFGLAEEPLSPLEVTSWSAFWAAWMPWLQWVTQSYGRWLVQVVTRLDFGESFVYSRSVASLIRERLSATLMLAMLSIVVTWAIALPLGVISAVRQNQPADRLLRAISYIGQGFPSFVTALLLLFVAQNLSPLLPVGGLTSINHPNFSLPGKVLDILWHLLLPTIALSMTSFAGLQRIVRGSMLDVLRQDYIQTARAKGLPENRVIYVHALRNAVNPLITILGFEFASLLSGSFIAEYFFNLPGLGRLILQAVQAQDIYLVMASLMMGATMLIAGNLLADLLLKVVDPRIQLSRAN
ncbi:MAG: ABC transporter permease [Spirulinaceae cyanobacterium RM2_2_10]|nr:ABC transporter permease [Spirulinaceae cyanobacterium SM2_1_0]NJO21283.1 ABC transporter permease [Spirulinaceae cyanobacterium RM2_2_10]